MCRSIALQASDPNTSESQAFAPAWRCVPNVISVVTEFMVKIKITQSVQRACVEMHTERQAGQCEPNGRQRERAGVLMVCWSTRMCYSFFNPVSGLESIQSKYNHKSVLTIPTIVHPGPTNITIQRKIRTSTTILHPQTSAIRSSTFSLPIVYVATMKSVRLLVRLSSAFSVVLCGAISTVPEFMVSNASD
jgi:hypothetical protein